MRGQAIFIVDANRGGQHDSVPADEKLTAFVELEAAIRAGGAIVLDERVRFLQNSASLRV